MYSRNVSFKLKAKSAAEFTKILEGEVIPLLRRQRGFDDAISFIGVISTIASLAFVRPHRPAETVPRSPSRLGR